MYPVPTEGQLIFNSLSRPVQTSKFLDNIFQVLEPANNLGHLRPGVPGADGPLPQEVEEPTEGEAHRRQLRLDGAAFEADQGKFRSQWQPGAEIARRVNNLEKIGSC